VSTFLDRDQITPGSAWRDQLQDAANDAQNIVVLVGPRKEPGAFQGRQVQAALQAIWSDPSKRVIPVLLGNAKPPSFVRSTATTGQPLQAIRVGNPHRSHDWDRVVEDLVRVVHGDADLGDVAEAVDTTREDRAQQRERFSYIKDVAESLAATGRKQARK
jgi:hypothetical protein